MLRFRINDGRESPEPAYAETKASILRRRNTMAKMHQEEAESSNKKGRGRGKVSRRHQSLNDISGAGAEDRLIREDGDRERGRR